MESSLNSHSCLPYHYGQVEGFFCPMSSGSITATTKVRVRGFNFYKSTVMPSGSYGGWSDVNGNLQSFQQDVPVDVLEPGLIWIPGTDYKPTFKYGWLDQYVTWKLVLSNPIPANGKVIINFSAGIWKFTLSSAAKCYMESPYKMTQVEHSCAISFVQDTSITFTLSSEMRAQEYWLHQYGVNYPETPAAPQTSSYSLSYKIETQTQSSVTIDESRVKESVQSIDYAPGYIRIDDVYFQYLNAQARGDFHIVFTLLNRRILSHQALLIELSMLVGNNDWSDMKCFFDKDFDFVSLEGTVLSSVTARPRYDLEPSTWKFKCLNVVTPSVYSAPKVRVFNGANMILNSQTTLPNIVIRPPASAIALEGFQLFKTIYNPSSQIAMSFSMTLTFDINADSAIYINLPNYYREKQQIHCLVNGEPAYCFYHSSATIKVKVFEIEIQAMNSFSILITGIT